MLTKSVLPLLLTIFALLLRPAFAMAQCPDEHHPVNYTGPGTVVCPCFIPGEQAGATFTIPAEHLPVEILRVGFGWASQFGGAPQSLENGINIYDGGLPNPGLPVFTLPGPLFTDGFINQFDLEPIPGEILITSSQVSATVTFLNQNAGDIFAPSIVHDSNGCVTGRNLILASPGGWADACLLGVAGNWVVELVYCARGQLSGVRGEEYTLTSSPTAVKLQGAFPNPFNPSTSIQFELPTATHARLAVHAIDGRHVAKLVDSDLASGHHSVTWQGRDDAGRALPSGIYFARLEAGGVAQTKRMVLLK